MKTPKAQQSRSLEGVKKQQSPALVGVRQLMKTRKSGLKSPDFVGFSGMLSSPQIVGLVSVDMSHQKGAQKKKAGKKR